MNRLIINLTLLLLSLSASMPAWAACTHYEMRVDGLACPYCAYGIEKKLAAIDGVHNLDVDLENGLVSVDVNDGVVPVSMRGVSDSTHRLSTGLITEFYFHEDDWLSYSDR